VVGVTDVVTELDTDAVSPATTAELVATMVPGEEVFSFFGLLLFKEEGAAVKFLSAPIRSVVTLPPPKEPGVEISADNGADISREDWF